MRTRKRRNVFWDFPKAGEGSLGREERNENGTRGVFLEAHVFNSSTSTWATRAKLVSRPSIFTKGRTTGMGKQSEG